MPYPKREVRAAHMLLKPWVIMTPGSTWRIGIMKNMYAKVPIVLPTFAIAATMTTRNSGMRHISVKLSASKIRLKSDGAGFRIFASTIAANQPAAMSGFNAVNQDTANPVSAESGCPFAARVKIAVSAPWMTTQ